MVKYNDVGQCPERYQRMGLCHTYFFKEFNLYPSILRINDDYLKNIKEKNFHDPILTYVALYLYHNYEIAQKYFKTTLNDKSYNTACSVLNRWLDQEKNIYTNFGSCYYNLRWWNIHIEPLWQTLKGYYPNKTCERYNSYYYKKTTLKEPNLINDGCYKLQVEDHVCYKPDSNQSEEKKDDDNTIEENCDKLSILFYLGEKYKLLNNDSGENQSITNNYCPQSGYAEKINYNPVLKAEKTYFCESITSIIGFPIILTVLGTIFLAFFLNEFTPLGSKLHTRYKNKLRLREQFNEESGYNEYQTYRNNNQNTSSKKNIIYYQSMNE